MSQSQECGWYQQFCVGSSVLLYWFLFNVAHRVESDLESMWFKVMFDKWISRHDTCIAVQKYY